MRLTLPSLSAWQNALEYWQTAEARNDLEHDLETFLDAVTALEKRACLATRTSNSLRDLVLESIPMRPNQGLYNWYGYRPGRSGFDVKAGLRLRVERAYFRASSSERSIANYLGATAAYYQLEETHQDSIRFHLVTVSRKPEDLRIPDRAELPDFNLQKLTAGKLFYRLLFFTDFVSKKLERSAMLLGAPGLQQLDTLSGRFLNHPETRCSDVIAKGSITCVEFDGSVTVSPEVAVTVNNQPRFVFWGASVRSLFEDQPQGAALKTLRIERKFGDSYAEVIFPRDDEAILSLSLVAGDRTSW